VRVSIASPLMLPSPFDRRVGIRIRTFEACSGFTHVTAHRIAQPPKAAFVTRLQPCRLPDRTARQLPDQSTTLWVESSSTSDPRLRGARSNAPFWQSAGHFRLPPSADVLCVRRHVSKVPEADVATLSQYELSSESVRTRGFACQMVFDVIGDLLADRRQLKQLVLHERIVGRLGKFPIHGRLAP
jgi:hypothetical protein